MSRAGADGPKLSPPPEMTPLGTAALKTPVDDPVGADPFSGRSSSGSGNGNTIGGHGFGNLSPHKLTVTSHSGGNSPHIHHSNGGQLNVMSEGEREELRSAVLNLLAQNDYYFAQQDYNLRMAYQELSQRVDNLRLMVKANTLGVGGGGGGDSYGGNLLLQHQQMQQQQQQQQAGFGGGNGSSGLNHNINNNNNNSGGGSPYSPFIASNLSATPVRNGGNNNLAGNGRPTYTNYSQSGGGGGYTVTSTPPQNKTSRSAADDELMRLLQDTTGQNGVAFNGNMNNSNQHMANPTSGSGWNVESSNNPSSYGGNASAGLAALRSGMGSNNNLHSGSGSPFHPGAAGAFENFMASPQAAGKTTLDDLMARFNPSSGVAKSIFNFDANLDNINESTSSTDLSQLRNAGATKSNGNNLHGGSPYRQDNVMEELIHSHEGAQHPLHRVSGGGNNNNNNNNSHSNTNNSSSGGAKNDVIPVDRLRALENQHFTRATRAVYESGRPRVHPVPGVNTPDSPEDVGINPASPCRVLVEFKRRRMLQYDSDHYVPPGSYVIVGGDRGEDLGLVTFVWAEGHPTPRTPVDGEQSPSKSADGRAHAIGVGLTGSELTRSIGVGNGTVLRLATPEDVAQLHGTQTELERRAIDVCTQKVLEHGLPMTIADAEYQFDKNKLTFFYDAQQRMDFRDLVKDLFKTFRARIWMELVQN